MTEYAYKYRMTQIFRQKMKKFFFVGAGGISMSGLAICLKEWGCEVWGSDLYPNAQTAMLEKRGIPVSIGADPSYLRDADIVVRSSAVPDGDVQIVAARTRGIPVIDRADLLSQIASQFENVIGVAGCHGKTTTTAMCAHVLDVCAGSCSAHIGGEDYEYGNFRLCGERYFVTEACEYKGSFLRLHPDLALILNTDADHLECYGGESGLCEAYRTFARGAKARIIRSGDRLVSSIGKALTFGFEKGCFVSASDLRASHGLFSFRLCSGGEYSERVRLNVYGRHNVLNALAAAAVARYYGYPLRMAAEGLERFTGIRRRFENIGTLCGARCIADYAHHPREIEATLAVARQVCEGRLFVVFQPHTYSRTRILFDDFVRVLSGIERLVLYKTYPAREYFDAAGSALTLSEHLPDSLYIESVRELEIYLNCSLSAGDTVLFLGAGDIYYAAKQVLKNAK